MYSLTLLGGLDLRAPDGRRVGSVLSQPKRLALLAVLALESPRRLQRDELTGLLWPEMPDDRARSSLRQSLYYLRRSLGPGVVTGKGEEGIGIDPDKLECDARELLRAAEESRCADVLRWHGGDLLPGFHIAETPVPFERWLDEMRRRVDRCTLECAWRLADEESRSGNRVAAAAAARRAWDLEPWGEAALQKLMRILVEADDVLGARAAYEDYAHRLAAEEQREPKPATLAILDEATADPPAREPAPIAAPQPVRPAPELVEREPAAATVGRRRWRRDLTAEFWAGSAVVLAAILLVVWAFLPAGESASAATDGRGLISGTPELFLETVRDLAAAERTSPRAEATTAALAGRLAEADAYGVALDGEPGDGSVRLRPTLQQRENGGVELSVLVLDGSSNAVLDRLTVEAESEAPDVAETLAARMASRVRRLMGELKSWRGLANDAIRPEALGAIRTAANELEAAQGLRRRGARDAAVTGYEAVDSLLARATELAPGWVEPRARRAELALAAMWLHLVPPHRDLGQAHQTILHGLEHAEAAVSVSPGARALEVRGILRHWAGVTTQDAESKASYLAAAERDLERAVRMNEDLPAAWDILSAVAEQRGDHALAYQRARKAYATDHALIASADILVRLFANALEVGDGESAAGWCREARAQQPNHWIGPYCDLYRMAWTGPWTPAASETLVEEGLSRAPDHAGGRVLAARFRLLNAVVLARAGRDDDARGILASVDGTVVDQSLEVLDLMAWARVALGDSERARQLLLAATDINPVAARRYLSSRRYAGLSLYAVVRADQ